MSLAHTRALLHAALDGSLAHVETVQDPVFGLHLPTCCAGIPAEILQPRQTWPDKAAYDAQARRLAAMFRENFAQYADQPAPTTSAVRLGPRVALEVLAVGPRQECWC
jgi:phosphoenolpyruvate carboxykinase (ATP)